MTSSLLRPIGRRGVGGTSLKAVPGPIIEGLGRRRPIATGSGRVKGGALGVPEGGAGASVSQSGGPDFGDPGC